MSIPEEKLANILKDLPEIDKEEVINFAEYLKEKRRKAIIKAFNSTDFDDEFSEEEIKKMSEEADNDTGLPAEEVYRKLGLL